jgi:hypothetical protein
MNFNLLKHISLGAIAVQFGTGVAFAQTVPNMVGAWSGQSHTISVDGSQINPSSTWDQPALTSRAISVQVTQQKDRRFWGKVYANGKSEGPFIGVLGSDGKTAAFVGPNATSLGTLIGSNKIQYCYTDASTSTGNSLFTASCSELVKK